MSEKAVLNVQAHVFKIDPETKKKWLPSSTASVKVSYYHDPSRKTYRIIAIESGKALINSTVTANMTFTKTSPKFGQWSDHRANTVYGLGFSSEKDLTLFSEKFTEAKSAAKILLEERKKLKQNETSQATTSTDSKTSNDSNKLSSPSNEQNGQSTSPITSPPISPSPGATNSISTPIITPVATPSATPSATPAPTPVPTSNGTDNEVNHSAVNPLRSNSASATSKQGTEQVDSLKFENSKLKVALASSAQNVKKWEAEMQTLRNNNAMLKTALEESTQHVSEWKKQLQKYKEECDQLKKKVIELETSAASVDDTKKENEELKEVLSAVQIDLQSKRNDVTALENSLASTELQFTETMNEKQSLETQLSEAKKQIDDLKLMNKAKYLSIQEKYDKLGNQLQQLISLHQELSIDLHN